MRFKTPTVRPQIWHETAEVTSCDTRGRVATQTVTTGHRQRHKALTMKTLIDDSKAKFKLSCAAARQQVHLESRTSPLSVRSSYDSVETTCGYNVVFGRALQSYHSTVDLTFQREIRGWKITGEGNCVQKNGSAKRFVISEGLLTDELKAYWIESHRDRQCLAYVHLPSNFR